MAERIYPISGFGCVFWQIFWVALKRADFDVFMSTLLSFTFVLGLDCLTLVMMHLESPMMEVGTDLEKREVLFL